MNKREDNRRDEKSTRRTFCLRAAAALALGGCQIRSSPEPAETGTPSDTQATDSAPDTSPPEDTAVDAVVFFSYEEHPQLQEEGGWVLHLNSNEVQIFVYNAPGEGVIAPLGICTHEGCPTEFVQSLRRHICPCHGARFKMDGAVSMPPATADLSRREVRVEEDGVYVDLGNWA